MGIRAAEADFLDATAAVSGPLFHGRRGAEPRRERAERARIWELPDTCHCVTIGTCLTLAELRRLALRLGLFANAERMTDYELHGAYVHAMDSRNRAANAVQKLLESNHAGAIRRSLRCADEEALAAFWDGAAAEGQIPGAFWAVLTHPRLGPTLEKRVFGEVHMMSHLCGASHRADARALAAVERQRNDIARRLDGSAAAHRAALAERDREIARLSRLVAGLEPILRETADLRRRVADLESGETLTALAAARDEAERRADRAERDAARMSAEARTLTERNDALLDRMVELEAVVRGLGTPAPSVATPGAACPLTLSGRCIAYIGGRPQTVSRIRSFVERCNGCLLHHDGGPEQSAETLDGILSRADMVVFPVDCVSHGAVEKLKSACARRHKAYAPLASSSFSAFAQALNRLAGSEPPAA